MIILFYRSTKPIPVSMCSLYQQKNDLNNVHNKKNNIINNNINKKKIVFICVKNKRKLNCAEPVGSAERNS